MKNKVFISLLALTLSLSLFSSMNYVKAELTSEDVSVEDEAFVADKTITYEADKQYTSLTFIIELEDAGEYSGQVLNGSNTFKCNQVDSTHLTCTTTNLQKGEIEIQLHNNDGSGNIGEVSVKMSMSSSSSTSTVDNIAVGEDLASLDLHFEDNVLVGSWTDTDLGNINVKIINVDSSETIMNDTVEGQEFRCDIPAYTKNIMVTIVPSSSANVEGAGKSIVLEVKDSANATVTYEDIDYTNKSSITVKSTLNDSYSVVVFDNEAQIYKADLRASGSYEDEIPLSEDGENNIKYYLVDANGNMYSTSKTIIKDTVGPALTFDYEYDNRATTSNVIELSGSVKDYETLTVNETPVDVTTDGSFTCNVSLHLGNNEIIFTALDIAGNETVTTFNITMVEKQLNPLPIIFTGIVALAIIGYFGYKKIKERPKKENANKKKTVKEKKPEKETPYKVPLKVKWERLKRNKRAYNIFEWIIVIIASLYTFFGLIYVSRSSSPSMEPTLMTNDMIIENRLAYVVHDIKRGDIVSIHRAGDSIMEAWGKRVIGLPGETVSFKDGYVYIDGELLEEDYIDDDIETNCQKTFTVPEGCYFVLGDNREVSNDSRFWDNPYVKESDIIAKYMFSIPTHYIFDLLK